jgi:hypothetical protein
MAVAPLRVGCVGMGWWSDVLADAVVRSKCGEPKSDNIALDENTALSAITSP